MDIAAHVHCMCMYLELVKTYACVCRCIQGGFIYTFYFQPCLFLKLLDRPLRIHCVRQKPNTQSEIKVLIRSCLHYCQWYKFSKMFYFVFILLEQSHSFCYFFLLPYDPQNTADRQQHENPVNRYSTSLLSGFFYGMVAFLELHLKFTCVEPGVLQLI